VRHAIGILLGLLLAPLLIGLAGWGLVRATQVGAVLDPKSSEVLSGLALLAAAGVVVGLLAAARWVPPSAALVVGLAYLGTTAYYILALDQFTKQLAPHGEVGSGIFGFVRTGGAALVGVALLISAAMPHRWAARQPDPPREEQPPYAELPPYQTSDYGTSAYSAAPGYSGAAPDYSTPAAGYSAPGYTTPGYSAPDYSAPGYAGRPGQHRAPDGTPTPPYYDGSTS
jgi:hypothetical protein